MSDTQNQNFDKWSDRWESHFQIEDYREGDDKKRRDKPYSYKNKYNLIYNNVATSIKEWLNQIEAGKAGYILLMDYDLGLFDGDKNSLNILSNCLENRDNVHVIIYSGDNHIKFKNFKNSHIITYYNDFKKHSKNEEPIKEICSLTLVSAKKTILRFFSPKKSKKFEAKADNGNPRQKSMPRIGHRAIIAAYLAKDLNTDTLLNKDWLKKVHEYSERDAGLLLIDRFNSNDVNNPMPKKGLTKIKETIRDWSIKVKKAVEDLTPKEKIFLIVAILSVVVAIFK